MKKGAQILIVVILTLILTTIWYSTQNETQLSPEETGFLAAPQIPSPGPGCDLYVCRSQNQLQPGIGCALESGGICTIGEDCPANEQCCGYVCACDFDSDCSQLSNSCNTPICNPQNSEANAQGCIEENTNTCESSINLLTFCANPDACDTNHLIFNQYFEPDCYLKYSQCLLHNRVTYGNTQINFGDCLDVLAQCQIDNGLLPDKDLLIGDLNQDKTIDITDLNIFDICKNKLLPHCQLFDENENQIIEVSEINNFKECLPPALFADIDRNGIVNTLDQSKVKDVNCFFQRPLLKPECKFHDANRDGIVNILDQTYVKRYLFQIPSTTEISPDCQTSDLNNDQILDRKDENLFNECEDPTLVPQPLNCILADTDIDGDMDSTDRQKIIECRQKLGPPIYPECKRNLHLEISLRLCIDFNELDPVDCYRRLAFQLDNDEKICDYIKLDLCDKYNNWPLDLCERQIPGIKSDCLSGFPPHND